MTSPPCDDDIEDAARYTSAYARFDVDRTRTVADFVGTVCPQIAYGSQGRTTGMVLPMRVGRPTAVACRIDGADGSIPEIVFTQRGATANVPPIDYMLAFKTTLTDYAADDAAFLRWLATVSIATPS